MKLFTVIVLVYNNSRYLRTCLDSVCVQDYPQIEIIVADDGSEQFNADEYRQYIKTHGCGNIVSADVYTNESNVGTVKNINIAIQRCHGQYIKLIAADDALYSSTVLSKAAEALRGNPIITSNVMRCDSELNETGLYRSSMTYQLNSMTAESCFKRLCIHNGIVAGGVFFTRKFIISSGCFDESYRLLEDWPKWLEITASGQKFTFCDFIAVKYRSNQGTGTSVNKQYMQDKRRVLDELIVPNRKRIGNKIYMEALVSYRIINSKMIRSLYAKCFRKKRNRECD